MEYTITLKRGKSIVKVQGEEFEFKTAFLKRLSVNDLTELLKDKLLK